MGDGEDRRLVLAEVVALRRALALALDQWRQTMAGLDELLTTCDRIIAATKRAPARPAKASDAEVRTQRAKEILMEFDERWYRHYGQPYYRVSPGEEARAAASLAKEPPERVSRWLARYFETERAYILERRHPFLLFVRTINEYRARQRPPGASTDDVDRSTAQTEAYLARLRGEA